MKDRPALKVVASNPSPKPSGDQIFCHRCEEDLGIKTSLFMPAVQSPMKTKNRIHGGTKLFICLHCISRGIVTHLF